mgnify:FL=1
MSGIQSIRNGLTGNITKIIVVAIIITFIGSVGWAGFLSQGNVNVIAKVGSKDITTTDLSLEASNQQFTLSQRFPDEEFEEELLFNLSKEVLIGKFSVLDFLDRKDLSLNEAFIYKQLSSEEQFLEGGLFSKNRFDSYARSIGYIPADYLKRIEEDFSMSIWNQSLIQSSFVTEKELDSSIKLANQERDISFLRIPFKSFQENISINQEDLEEIYNNNLSDYVNPEQVKVSYIELNPQKLEELIEISPEEINLEYQDYLNEFDSAIRKSVSHIMLNISDFRDLDAARKEIEVIKSRLTDGDSFESLVLELSEDEGTKSNQGSLGVTDGTLLPPEFEAALLTMDEGEYYGPIELLSSVHLIKLDEIIKPEPETLESKTQNIRENLISAKAEGMYIELLDRISNLTFSAEDIEQIGQEISQNVLSTEYLYEEELPDVLKGNSIKEYIFQEYGGDEYPELFETSQLSAVVLEVKGFNEEVQLSFDAVKSTIEDTYLNLETQKKVNNFLDDAITSLRADTTLEELSVSQKINIESYNKLKRDSSLFPLDVINTIFSLARSKAGEVYESAVLQNGDALIYRLDAVKEGSDGLNEETRQEFENLLSQQKTIAELSDLQQNLEENI